MLTTVINRIVVIRGKALHTQENEVIHLREVLLINGEAQALLTIPS